VIHISIWGVEALFGRLKLKFGPL